MGTSTDIAPSGPSFELRHYMARALEEAGLTTDDMARHLNCGPTTIRNYLRGRTRPNRGVLIAWAMKCGVPVEWLEQAGRSTGCFAGLAA